MPTKVDADQTYTIMETAKISGLPESTLRYYETIGIIEPIARDASSKHRVYSEDNLNFVVSLACLNATGMSIDDMRRYLDNRQRGASAAGEQIELLTSQKHRLAEEAQFMKVRQAYVSKKIDYWRAIEAGDVTNAQIIGDQAGAIAKDLKLSAE